MTTGIGIGGLCASTKREGQVKGLSDWLSLAAAPTFAIMALLAGALGGGQADMLCMSGHGASVLVGMVPMYLLMSVFHLAPWLRLASRRRS